MGALEKFVAWLGGGIFIFSLIGLISVNALSHFSKYENIKPVFVDVLQVQLEKQIESMESGDIELPPGAEVLEINESEEIHQLIMDACVGKDTVEIPMSEATELGFGDLGDVTIDCNDFRTIQVRGISATQYLTSVVAEGVFDSIYYKTYDCEFLACMQRGDFLVFLSPKGHKFMNNMKMVMLGGIGVGIAAILMSHDKWDERLKGFGWPMVFTGVSYFIFGALKNLIIQNLPSMFDIEQAGVKQTGVEVMRIVDVFMGPLMNSLIVVMAVGIVLLVGGYAVERYEKRRIREPRVVIK